MFVLRIFYFFYSNIVTYYCLVHDQNNTFISAQTIGLNMVDPRLVEYIKTEELQGYTETQLRQYLISQGYNPQDVYDAIAAVRGGSSAADLASPASPNGSSSSKGLNLPFPKKYLFMILVGLVFVSLASGAVWYLSRPVCGNGVLEDGETILTCCADAGCLGDQSCVQNTCIEPVCGDCQELVNHACVDLECCSDVDCGEGQFCEGHSCKDVECGDCQYLEGSVCKDYACCSDADCDDGDVGTKDICADPFSKQAMCFHKSAHECSSNSDCDDGDPSTDDTCSGNPRKCLHSEISACTSGDGYCPSACNYTLDTDCPKPDECQADVDCDDNVSATIDTCTDTIPRICDHQFTTECVTGDLFCPEGCDYYQDHDCEAPPDECEFNSDCDDGKTETRDSCTDGVPRVCVHDLIVGCVDSDGYCPDGCTSHNDDDCVLEGDLEMATPLKIVDSNSLQENPSCSSELSAMFTILSTFDEAVDVSFITFVDDNPYNVLSRIVQPGLSENFVHPLGMIDLNNKNFRIEVNTEKVEVLQPSYEVLVETDTNNNIISEDLGVVCQD